MTTYETSKCPAVMADATSYLVTKIQDGSQLTGSTNISETMTYTINIPTANLRHLTTTNSQEVYLGIPITIENRKWRRKPEILMYLKLWKVQLKFQRQIWGIRPCHHHVSSSCVEGWRVMALHASRHETTYRWKTVLASKYHSNRQPEISI